MGLYEVGIRKIEENLKNEVNCIPFGFPRFEEYLPGISQKQYYILTANAGIGKTQITDFMFLYAPFNYVSTHETDVKLKIFYYSLEMDKESKIIAGMSKYIYEKYKIKFDVALLESKGKNRLTNDQLQIIYNTRDYFDRLGDVLTIHDDQINPYGIFKELDTYAKNNGKIVTKEVHVRNPDTGVLETKHYFDYYIPNNPKEYVIVITDHVAELSSERGHDGRSMDLKGTIEKHSDNMRILRNKYGFTLVDVQQQMASKEDQEFYKGLPIITRLEPSFKINLIDNQLIRK